MALNIKDAAAEQAVRQLAAATGESITAAIRKAAEERLARIRRAQPSKRLADQLLEIGRRCSSLPDLDTRATDEILGYDENGLPR